MVLNWEVNLIDQGFAGGQKLNFKLWPPTLLIIQRGYVTLTALKLDGMLRNGWTEWCGIRIQPSFSYDAYL